MMKMMMKATWVVVVIVGWLVGDVDAFRPLWPLQHHRQMPTTTATTSGSRPSLATSTTSTTEEKQQQQQRQQEERMQQQRLTEQEEAILFGDVNGDSISNGVRYPQQQQHERRHKDKFGNVLVDKTTPVNPLDHAKDPVINKLHTIRETIQSCPELWLELAKTCPDRRAVFDEHMGDTTVDQTFAEFSTTIQKSATVFQSLGIQKGTNVAMFGENSATWLMIDQGIQYMGGRTAVRGADAPLDELRYIYEHSDSAAIAILQGPKLLQKLAATAAAASNDNNKSTTTASPLGLSNPKYGPVKTVILMHREKKTNVEIAKLADQLQITIHVFGDLLQTATPMKDRPMSLSRSDLATIVYTSGTTGHPKGVMLSHGNLLHQIGHRLAPTKPYEQSEPLPGETMVSILPVWHITERTFELWMAARGCSIVYSSIRTFKKDLAKHRPEWMVLVPRVLEKIAGGVQEKFASGSAAVKILSKFFTRIGQVHAKHQKIVNGLVVANEPVSGMDEIISRILVTVIKPIHAVGNKLVWSKVRDGFGGRLKVIISGGSALAGGLESFYEAAGMTVCVGYGLTECSPLITFRRSDRNLVTGGCAGTACTGTEFRIVNPTDVVQQNDNKPRAALPNGEPGLIIAKGPQVMQGYYKNKEATDKAIDKFGWFDTGDLGFVNPITGDLILTGRAKDTIVLSNGENIEPVPIEDAIIGAGPLVDQVMLTGQDGRSLLAITVLNPAELLKLGFLDKKQADQLQEAIEKVNDPKCSVEDCETYCKVLVDASKPLRSNKELGKVLTDVFKRATSGFRSWEKVNDYYLTLEPFAMANGQLTQSYKVKRTQVLERYANELPK